MASLLLPGENIYLQSQRNPDWLAELVFKGQQMRQNQIQLQQAQQRIDQAKAFEAAKTEQFWAEQARLKGQQDFQNSKFLYEIGRDQRAEERQRVNDDRTWQNTQAVNARQAERDAWDRNPANPLYQSRAAGVEATKSASYLAWLKAQDEGYVPADQVPPFTPDAPDTTELGGWQGNAQSETPTGAGGVSEGALTLLGGAEERAQQQPPANPMVPDINVIEVAPGVKAAAVTQKSATGRPKSTYLQFLPSTKPTIDPADVQADPSTKPTIDPADVQADKDRAALAGLQRSLKPLPMAPDGEMTDDQRKAFEAQRAAVEADNAVIRKEIGTVAQRLDNAEARKRLAATDLRLDNPTEDFQKEVMPELGKALEKKDPAALRALRSKVEALTKTGDPSAVQTLQFIDSVLGPAGPVAKPRPTGYY